MRGILYWYSNANPNQTRNILLTCAFAAVLVVTLIVVGIADVVPKPAEAPAATEALALQPTMTPTATEVPQLQPLPAGVTVEKMPHCGDVGAVGLWSASKAPFTGSVLVCGADNYWDITRLFYNGVEYQVPVLVNDVPVAPTATSAPIASPTPLATATPIPKLIQSADWKLTWFAGADKDRGDGTTFRQSTSKWNLRKVAPELWPTFPNVPNPLVPEFRVINGNQVPDGLESAMDESNFCQQLAGEACNVPVDAMHYLYFSGDYNVPNIGSCEGSVAGTGCMLVIVNVGGVTSDFTGVFGQGFRLHARYFNGNALDMAIWALTSHGANTMMNLNSALNPPNLQNAGANCSVPAGCKSVHIQVVFVSGNELLLDLTTLVTR